MFRLRKKKPEGKNITFTIEGMHCTSCAMNIDGELEELAGVSEARTSYAKGETRITYDPQHVNTDQLIEAIHRAGYRIREQ
jgi:copper chaperone CopZ